MVGAKKIVILLCILLMATATLCLPLPAARADADNIDQYCYSGSSEKLGLNAYTMFQTFNVSYKYVTRIAVFIQGSGNTKTMVGPDKDGNFYEDTITGPGDPAGDWVIYTPPHPLEVIPGRQVVIYLYSTTNLPLYWFYRDDSCYADGTMWYLPGPTEIQGNRDMGFISYGTNELPAPGDDGDTTPPADDSTPSDDTASGSTSNGAVNGDTAGNVDSNALVISSKKVDKSLRTPSELKATQFYVGSKANVKLNWKEPDSKKIDGYNIYRKALKEEKFIKIASTAKGVPTYIDQNVTVGQKYSYVVRLYTGESESLNSNQADITIAKKPVAAQKTNLPWYKIFHWLSWWMILIYILLAAAIAALIIWLMARRKRKKLYGASKPIVTQR